MAEWHRIITSPYTGSLEMSGSFNLAGNSTISGNVTINGTASVNNLIVNQIGYSSGSNQLGDAANDTQTLYGTVVIPTGSLTVNGDIALSGSRTIRAVTSTLTNSGASLTLRGGNATTGSYTYGGSVTIQGGDAISPAGIGGDVYIYGGSPAGSQRSGYIYIGTPSGVYQTYLQGSPIFNWDGPDTANAAIFQRNGATRFSIYDDVKLNANYYFNAGGSTINAIWNNWKSFIIKGSGTTSATTALSVQNANASSSFQVLDDGSINTYGTITSNATGFALFKVSGNGVRMGNLTFDAGGLATTNGGSAGSITLSSANFNIGLNKFVTVNGSLSVIGPSALTGSAVISGSAGTGSALQVYKSGSTVLDIQGSTGQLFSVTDSLTGSLFSVNTVSGLPVMEAFSDNTVNIGKFGTYPIKVVSSGTLANITGSFTGSYSGSGGGLYGIPASGIVGLNLSQIATGSVSASVSLGTGSFTVTSGSTNLLFVSSSGNVGVGTTTPAYKLDTVGTSRLDGILLQDAVSDQRITGNRPYFFLIGGGAVFQMQGGNFSTGQYNTTAKFDIKGSGTTSSTTALLVQNANASASLVVNDNGAVAIGQSTPFSFAGNNSLTVNGCLYTATDGNAGTPALYIGSGGGGAGRGFYGAGSGIAVSTNNATSMYFKGSPNLGSSEYPRIGINVDPTSVLDIRSDYTSSNLLNISSSIGTVMFISSSGNIGIGKNNPATTLDVSGSGRFTNGLTNTGSFAQSGSSTFSGGTYTFQAAGAGDSGLRIDTTINGYASLNWLSNTVGLGLMAGGGLFAKVSNAAGFHIGQSQNSTFVAALAVTGHGTTTSPTFVARNSAGTNILRVVDSGLVGINNAAPSASLHVIGNTILSGSAGTGSALTVYKSGSTVVDIQGSQGQLFSITDSLSGSLFSVSNISGLPIVEVFSDNTTLMGSYIAPALHTTNKITSTTLGANVVYSLATASYDGVFVDYTVKSGSNARAGNFAALWSGSQVNYMDNSTTDFGDTSGVFMSGSVSGSNMVVFVSASAGWTFKGIIRSI